MRQRARSARCSPDRGQLPDGEQLQGPDRQSARVRGRHCDLGADPHHLRRQQPLRHDPVSAGPLRHREPRRRHVREPLSRPGHDLRGFARGHSRELDPGPPLAKSLYELTAAERDELQVKPLPRNLDQAISGFARPIRSPSTSSATPCTGSTRCISRTSGIASTRRLPIGRSGSICGSSKPRGSGVCARAFDYANAIASELDWEIGKAVGARRRQELRPRQKDDCRGRARCVVRRDGRRDLRVAWPLGLRQVDGASHGRGLEAPSIGAMFLDGKEIHGPDKSRGMVFQRYTSFDWMTVRRNVEYGMGINEVPRQSGRKMPSALFSS